ncbi:unnamed protein product [Protopolystoma xenopodis]|uniref:Uncharacterized protein n=1 Tax=Protopolystoma xenopodis TaxID=117903 RepID=A0A448XAU9_9PLAT|nr:unnamed protein product [Protopolystoma xenopodis]
MWAAPATGAYAGCEGSSFDCEDASLQPRAKTQTQLRPQRLPPIDWPVAGATGGLVTFSDAQLQTDRRQRISQALHSAGLLDSDYARQLLANVPGSTAMRRDLVASAYAAQTLRDPVAGDSLPALAQPSSQQ